jgi:cytochrome c biogenesis protein CcmG/thiol:disulfide interchange protein DsbE
VPRNTLALVAAAVAIVVVAITVNFYFGAGAGSGAGPMGRSGGGPAMLAGAPAQSYTVKSLAGSNDGLDRYRGSVVLVNLWASWCAPCRSETPALEQLYEAERRRGLVVLGIDQGESAAAAATFSKEMKLTYPILVDEDQQYGRAYAAVGLPTSLIVDASGHIVRGIDGELTLAQMHEAVDPLLRAAHRASPG